MATAAPTPPELDPLEQRLQTLAADDKCTEGDRLDTAFALLAATHPDACSCPGDYPDWKPEGVS